MASVGKSVSGAHTLSMYIGKADIAVPPVAWWPTVAVGATVCAVAAACNFPVLLGSCVLTEAMFGRSLPLGFALAGGAGALLFGAPITVFFWVYRDSHAAKRATAYLYAASHVAFAVAMDAMSFSHTFDL
jgi:hypothetical protein